MHSAQKHNHGFTLIELSIVLVIIGLIVGGVLVGRDLIKASELRSVITQQERFVTATYAFRNKYSAIPGDMTNATTYWGKDNTNCSSDIGTAGTPGTCNGNGDNLIGLAGANATGEMYQIWKHLSLAGYIEGAYSGIGGSSGQGIAGTNIPSTKLAKGGWSWYSFALSGHPYWTDNAYGTVLFVGGEYGGSSSYAPLFTPAEAQNIDRKLDDGKPTKGKVWGVHWGACTTAISSADLNGEYAITTATPQCALAFPNSLN